MAQACDGCGKLFATSALLQLLMFEMHGAATAPKALTRIRSRPLKNEVPSTPSEARKSDKKARPKKSKSVRTVPGGRSLTKFR